MGEGYGIEIHGEHSPTRSRDPARFLVLIDGGGEMFARLFSATRVQVAEFDASTEEVAVMIHGLTPQHGAAGSEWDRALLGHSPEQRAEARIYTLEL